MSKIFLWMAVLLNVCLILSNLFASKIFMMWDWCVLPGAVIIFPISYILNDCLCEVYGYRKAQLVIWTGFAMNLFFILVSTLVIALPGAPFWDGQEAYRTVFASTPRTLAASLLAFLVGSSLNAMVMSHMKVADKGKKFGLRAIVSSIIGESVDSLIFIPIVFYQTGIGTILTMMACQIAFKVLYEILILPVTSLVVKKVKTVEGIDTYDYNISYNPFKL